MTHPFSERIMYLYKVALFVMERERLLKFNSFNNEQVEILCLDIHKIIALKMGAMSCKYQSRSEADFVCNARHFQQGQRSGT